MKRPFIPLLLPLIAGILIGYGVRLPGPSLWIALSVVLAFLLTASVFKRRAMILPLAMSSLLILGILNINPYLYPDTGAGYIGAFTGKEKVVIEGMICESPRRFPEKTELKIVAWQIVQNAVTVPVRGNVRLTIPGHPSLAYGDVVRFHTRLRFPHNFNNPGGTDIEKRYLLQETIVRGFIGSAADMVVLRKQQGNRWKTYLENFRNDLRALIAANAPAPNAQIIQAAILGNQQEIPSDVTELFNRTGTSHIIAISGFNIGIIAACSLFLIRGTMKLWPYLLLRFDMNKVAAIATVVPIVGFTYAAGAGISVVRATIMVITFMVALLIGRRRDMVNTLAIAAFIILAVAPYSLFDVSFQLSFLAVGSILGITPVLSRFLPAAGPSPLTTALRTVMLFLFVTLSATLGTLPLIAFYFNRVSIVVLPANLATVPILGILVIPVSTAVMAIVPFSTDAAIILIRAASALVDVSLHIIRFFSSPTWSSLPVGTPSIFEIGLYYLFLYAVLRLLQTFRPGEPLPADNGLRRRRYALVGAVCVTLFIADGTFLYFRDNRPGNLTITFIDVGQGNAALIRFPQGTKMLVDGGGVPGGTFDIGKNVLAPYLHHEKIGKIHIAVLTHPHPDHLDGLIWILKHFRVDEVWSNGMGNGTDRYRQMLTLIREQRIRHRIVSTASSAVVIDGVTIRILNPETMSSGHTEGYDDYASANADSVVMRLVYGQTAFLLTADICGTEEARILRSGADIGSQVLLVPHHGSAASSTISFLAAVQPEVAVVSCGRDNPFGFPHPDVVERLQPHVTKLYRTDINGAITVTSDGKKCQSSSWLP